jgi:hypothetical protein
MEATIRQHFIWPKLRKHVNDFCCTCPQCQIYKKRLKKYGHLPAMTAEETPWLIVNIDLISPYTVTTPNGTHTLWALTMIDPATNWFEVTSIANKEAATVMEAFNNDWLSRYPRVTITVLNLNQLQVTIHNPMELLNEFIKFLAMRYARLNLRTAN